MAQGPRRSGSAFRPVHLWWAACIIGGTGAGMPHIVQYPRLSALVKQCVERVFADSCLPLPF